NGHVIREPLDDDALVLQFLAIGLCTRSDSKTAEQFAEHNTVDPNARDMREHLHRLGCPLFEGHIGIGIEQNVPHCHNAGSTCSKSATACKKAMASSSLHVPASASRS